MLCGITKKHHFALDRVFIGFQRQSWCLALGCENSVESELDFRTFLSRNLHLASLLYHIVIFCTLLSIFAQDVAARQRRACMPFEQVYVQQVGTHSISCNSILHSPAHLQHYSPHLFLVSQHSKIFCETSTLTLQHNVFSQYSNNRQLHIRPRTRLLPPSPSLAFCHGEATHHPP